MINLKRHTKIETYDIIDTLSDVYHSTYRAVFLVKDTTTQQLFAMTVYDMDLTPMELKSRNNNASTIREFERCAGISSINIPAFYEQGEYNVDGKNMKWMCCQYFESMTLTDHIKCFGTLSTRDAATLLADICVAAHDIAKATNDGGHNNITPENILVGKYEDGELHAMLTGLIYASEPCHGRPSFPAKGIDKLYRAPETYLGQFDCQSDVYSLGIVFAYMLLGYYPWDTSTVNKTNAQAEMNSILEIRKGDVAFHNDEPAVKEIVMKALTRSLSKRYKTADEFISALSEAVGLDLKVYKTAENEEVSNINAAIEENIPATDTVGRPSSGVVIQKAKGKGYAEVGGMSSLKNLFTRNFISIVKNIEMAKQFDITPNNATLIYGAPGVGKSFIVEKTAEEAGLNYTMVKPSDLASIYIHGSQSMIADVFKKAEEMAPVLLCFDEIDAMIPARTADDKNNNGGEVNEFLAQLNNCAERGIYVMGTTNRPDRLDKAALRKGRFEQLIYIPLPDLEARKSIFEIELAKRPYDESVDTNHLASLTEDYTSSDISYIVKEAARISFENSIKNGTKTVCPINEKLLESVVSNTSSSVSYDDIKRYEQIEKELSNKKESRSRIGYIR